DRRSDPRPRRWAPPSDRVAEAPAAREPCRRLRATTRWRERPAGRDGGMRSSDLQEGTMTGWNGRRETLREHSSAPAGAAAYFFFRFPVAAGAGKTSRSPPDTTSPL